MLRMPSVCSQNSIFIPIFIAMKQPGDRTPKHLQPGVPAEPPCSVLLGDVGLQLQCLLQHTQAGETVSPY